MAGNTQIPEPDSALVAWALANPEAVRNAIRLLNLLSKLEVRFSSTVGPPSGGWSLVESKQNIVLPIPQLAMSVSAPAGGATIDTQCRAQLTMLLTLMRRAGYIPGG